MLFKLYFSFLFAISLATLQASAFTCIADTVTNVVPKKSAVTLSNNETPTILRRGETLVVKIDAAKAKTTIRIHSSLGKLVKEFAEVEKQISMFTDKLLPGVYLIIIKQDDKREVRKLLLTE